MFPLRVQSWSALLMGLMLALFPPLTALYSIYFKDFPVFFPFGHPQSPCTTCHTIVGERRAHWIARCSINYISLLCRVTVTFSLLPKNQVQMKCECESCAICCCAHPCCLHCLICRWTRRSFTTQSRKYFHALHLRLRQHCCNFSPPISTTFMFSSTKKWDFWKRYWSHFRLKTSALQHCNCLCSALFLQLIKRRGQVYEIAQV